MLGSDDGVKRGEGVKVGEFEKPNLMAAVCFVMVKNARLKMRSWVGTLVEILLPALFMTMLVPAYVAAGFDSYGNREFLDNHMNVDDYFRPWMCTRNGQTVPSGYSLCTDSPPEHHCLGNLCLNSSISDGDTLGRVLNPWFDVTNSTTIPSFDVVALWRHFAQTIELPGESDEGVNMANALRTGEEISVHSGDGALLGQFDDWFTQNTYTYQFVRTNRFATEKDATDYASTRAGSSKIWAVVVLNGATDYTIRMNRTSTPDTESYTTSDNGLNDGFRTYLGGGFLTIQALYNRNITGSTVADEPLLVPMPVQGYRSNSFLKSAGDFLPMIMTLAFLFPLSQIVSAIVKEKESRIREAMLIMGLPSAAFKLSWLFTAMVQMAITGLLLSIVVVTSFLDDTDYFLILVVCQSYCLSLVAAGMLMSVFFSKASLASLVSPMVYLLTAIPSFILGSSSTSTQRGLSIFNTYAFSQALDLLFDAAGKGDSITWSSIGDGSYSLLTALGFMWGDTVVYLLLAAWLDQVLPSEWGAKKPFYYFCWPPLWFKSEGTEDEVNEAEDGMMNRDNLEEITDQDLLQKERIKVKNLRKEFKRDGHTNVAVNNVNLSLYEGQILALLGHNGAGKTTLINMLTGMLPVTSGDASVFNNSVRYNMEAVRKDIGLCPQHNILWDNMTCAEHLRYYGRVKGVPGTQLEEHVDDILRKVELDDKKDVYSMALSGGMKRKLSVGISLMGGPKFLILDEPTAGMDVQARRAVWDLLKTVRAGRTILLTTHFMDEADLLGDSIAILHDGRVNCWGSSFFLKQKLGVGYNLTMELAPGTDVSTITNTIKEEVGPLKGEGDEQNIELLSSAGSELAYRVPMWGLPNFASLFEQLEVRGKELGVNTFGISVTTLEEIFIKIAHDNAKTEPDAEPSPSGVTKGADGGNEKHLLEGIDIDPADRMQGAELYSSQWTGLFYKRFIYSKRDKCTICFQLVLPVVVVLYTLALVSTSTSDLSAINLVQYDEDSIYPVSPVSSPYAAEGMIEGVSPRPDLYGTAANMSNYLLHRDGRNVKCWQALFQETAGLLTPRSAFFNSSSLHSLPIMLNGYASLLYRQQQNDNATGISVTNHPLPYSDYFKDQEDSNTATVIAINIILPFCFIPANYVAFLVRERVSKSKHVQIVSGVRLSAYWLSNFCWDLVSFIVSTFLSVLVFLIFDREEFVGSSEAFIAVLLLFFFYGVTAIFASYFASFYFESATTGQNTVLLGNYFSGFALTITIAILQGIESTEDVAKVLRFIFRVVPAFCLGDGVLALAQLPANRRMGATSDTPLSMDVVGWDIVFMCIMFPLYAFGAISHDFPEIWYKLGLQTPPNTDVEDTTEGEDGKAAIMDDDVAAEKAAVMAKRDGDVVEVRGVRKVYPARGNQPPKVAVREVTFGVKTDEIFAFLGTNGAGKTSTISVLAGDYAPTAGTASIKGHDVVTDAAEAKRELGYCPQFDALLDMLTPREHIELYASLRGVPTSIRGEMANSLIQVLGLQEHENTVCKKLSGGNKRKTSIAISLIGGPSCILLDEPTAGMDPVARRGMWSALQAIGKGRCVVLTTHHLEEVEALAHRTAIMVDGGLQCLGTLSHLKNKFGGAYEVQVKVAPEGEEAFQDFFKTTFPSSDLVEQTNHRLTYQLPAGQRLSEMFSIIQSSRDKLGIVDYSISETSLEQVFIAICKKYVSES